MIFTSALCLVLASLAPAAHSQDLSAAHNVTSLVGTWSSGSRAVQTGAVSVPPLYCDLGELTLVSRASRTQVICLSSIPQQQGYHTLCEFHPHSLRPTTESD